MKLVALLAAVAALGAVVAAVAIGLRVREDTVVAHPYEEGLAHDAEAREREALGWRVEVGEPPAAGAPAGLGFRVLDRAGRPVEGAAVAVTASRPDTGHLRLSAAARAEGAGYAAALAFPAAGPWELAFDVRRGPERARLTRTVQVRAGGAGCDLAAGPCPVTLGDAELMLELGPRPLRTMAELSVAARLRAGGAPLDGAAVEVAFEMPGMEMGPNRVRLAGVGDGRYAGRAVLVRCPSGRPGWRARVAVTPPGGARREAALDFAVAE
ncbi:MAG TPA: FixH family protein [Anaeromyxobacter sp.]|nr:FixH family protein [Anaeromyxobacter sp.]